MNHPAGLKTGGSNVRAIYAAGLLTALVALLLGVWFVSGWRDVRMRQAEITRAPHAEAERRAAEVARELRADLEGLLTREFRRPYFHYQNLMHDPQTTAGLNVSRSPLASGPEEPLVRGYFQLDAKGRATTPTLNDEVPELSASEHLADHRAFRDMVARDLSRPLAPAAKPNRQLATRSGSPAGAGLPGPAQPKVDVTPPPVPEVVVRAPTAGVSQTIQIDPRVYAQNANPNRVYEQSQAPRPAPPPPAEGRKPPTLTISPLELRTLPFAVNSQTQASKPPENPPPPPAPEPVTITISPLEWRTMPFAGGPTLLAVRQVETPDDSFTQGLVVDQRALNDWLIAKAGDTIPVLRPDTSLGAVVAPDWGLTVEPKPDVLRRAAEESHALARGFVVRFAGVSGVSVVAATLVMLLVARAEKLARERSQFAAAAAHELRTPLAGLQLYGDMLADGLGQPDKMRDYARRMSDDAARLGRVVSNILGFSQLERGSVTVDAQAGPLDEVLCELAERVRPALDRAGAALEIDIPRGLRARFDRDALARVVGNLLDNAEKYARDAADRTIRLEAVDRNDVVEVRVADRGQGIADSSKLFRAFSRGKSGGDAAAGLGLGLALSRSLAHAMGGDLTYRPREGGGATFVLQLRRG